MSKKEQVRQKGRQSASPKAAESAPKAKIWDKFPWQAVPWIVTALLAVVSVIALGAMNRHYLFKAESLSFFVPTRAFFQECMRQPAGLVVWLSTFLTQFFARPWLGACVYAACLVGFAWLVAGASRLRGGKMAFAAVPGLMAMLAFLSLGYVIITIKSRGIAYSPLVGMAFAAALAWIYRLASNRWVRAAVALLIVAIGFPLIGAYSLLAAMLCVIVECVERGKWWWVPVLASIAACVIVPQACYRHGWCVIMKQHIYDAGWPRFYREEWKMWLPYAAAFVTLGACMAIGSIRCAVDAGKKYGCAALASLAIAVACVFVCRYRDENFNITIAMDHYMQQQQWDKALSVASKQKGEPTRINVLFTDISLFNLGREGDEMFKYKISSQPYNTTRSGSVMMDLGAKMLYMHTGRVNDALRWAMEDKVENGQKVEYLKYMTKFALLTGEYPLAQKYINILSNTMMHKAWARKYQEMVDNPSLVDADPELGGIRKLMSYGDNLGTDGGKLESQLMPMLASLSGGTDQMLQLSMMANLIQKDVDTFWPKLFYYNQTHDRLPVHYQEAAMIYNHFNNNPYYGALKIDTGVEKRFQEFLKFVEMRQTGNDQIDFATFRPAYGDTYWFYYFYNNGMKTL